MMKCLTGLSVKKALPDVMQWKLNCNHISLVKQ